MATNKRNIPKHELEALARCFLPDIQAFFETEESRKEYEAWREARDGLREETDSKTA